MFCVTAIALAAHADSGSLPVEGAFGIMLGKAPDTAVVGERFDGEGGQTFRFRPESPYAPLTDYVVSISPHDASAYRIEASGKLSNAKACRTELERLKIALAQKYGPARRDIAAQEAGAARVSFGNEQRYVTASCSGLFGKQTLKLVYGDKALEKQARRPLPSSDASPTVRDTGGL